MIEQIFLKFSADKLHQLRGRIHDCANRLTEEQIWVRQSQNENTIGNLILHLTGNVRQWIGHSVGGAPDTRDRDSEFAAHGGVERAVLLIKLDEVLDNAVEVINTLPPDRLTQQITIQKYNVTVMEAIYHVVEHFAQHTAQIIFATKLLTGEDLEYYKHLSRPAHKEATP